MLHPPYQPLDPKPIRTLLLLGSMFALFGLSSCTGEPATTVSPDEESDFSGARALGLVEEQVEMGPRFPGSDGHARVQEWIGASLEAYGWDVRLQGFMVDGLELANIVAGQPGADGAVMLGAHYDTRPVADQDPASTSEPVPGANDGASGVAVLLELARVLPTWSRGCQPNLVFFDAEDSGDIAGWDWHEGADFYVENVDSLPTALVVVDMVGDRDLDIFLDLNSDEALSKSIWDRARALGYQAFIPQPKYAMIDDHTPFAEAGVRSALLIDFDYPFWHTTNDTPDKASGESLEAVGRTVQSWLLDDCLSLIGG